MQTGIVRNNTGVPQSWGKHTIAPHAFGELPIEVIESLLRHPMKELTVIQNEISNAVFRRTEHWPDGIRFQERAHHAATHRR